MKDLRWGRVTTFAALFFCCVFILGCATLKKEECMTADWRTIGYEDGAKGYPTSRIAKHRKACADYGVSPNFESYEEGRLQGLQEFCTPQRGYRMGASGQYYSGVCPKSLEPVFLDGYYQGKKVHNAKRTLNAQQADLKDLYGQLKSIEKLLKDSEAELVKKGTTVARRKALLNEIKLLTEDQHYLINETAVQEKVVEDARINFNALKKQNSY